MLRLLPDEFDAPPFPTVVELVPLFQQLGWPCSQAVRPFVLLLQLHPGHQGGELIQPGSGGSLPRPSQSVVPLQLRVEGPSLLVQLSVLHADFVELLPFPFQTSFQQLLDGLHLLQAL